MEFYELEKILRYIDSIKVEAQKENLDGVPTCTLISGFQTVLLPDFEWVPVKERLPEYEAQYNSGWYIWYDGKSINGKYYEDVDAAAEDIAQSGATHWANIPVPPVD